MLSAKKLKKNTKGNHILEIAKRRMVAGQYDCAIECCNKLLSLKSYDNGAHFLKGCAFYHLKHFCNAEKEFASVLKHDPTHRGSLVNMLRSAINSSGDNIKFYELYSSPFLNKSAEVNLLMGILFSKMGSYDKAFEYFRQAKSIDPYDYRLYANIGTSMLSRPNLSEIGYMQAACCLSRSIKLFPPNRFALYNRCRIWIHTNNAERAVNDGKALMFLDNNNPSFNFLYAKALFISNEPEKAKLYFKRAFDLASDVYIKKEAEKELKKLNKLLP